MGRHFFNLCVFLTLASSVFAGPDNTHLFTQYTIDDGLPSNVIYAVEQDNLGFIWLGTGHGLSRFDGTHFINYSVLDQAPDSDILKFYKDQLGQIWCYTNNGKLAVIYNGKIHSDTTITGLKLPDLDQKINSITENKGAVLVSSSDKIAKSVNSEFELLGQHYIDPYIIINQSGVYCLESTGDISLFHHDLDSFVRLDNEVEHFSWRNTNPLVHNEVLYSAHNSLLFDYHFQNNVGSSRDLSIGKIYNIVSLDTTILLCASEGVYQYHIDDEQVSLWSDLKHATSVFKDRDGNIWLSSLNGGVQFLSNSSIKFHPTRMEFKKITSNKEPWFLSEDNETIYRLLENDYLSPFRDNENIIIRDAIELNNSRIVYGTNKRLFGNIGSDYMLRADQIHYSNSKLSSSAYDWVYGYSFQNDSLIVPLKKRNRNFGKIIKLIEVSDSMLTYLNYDGIYRYDLLGDDDIEPIFEVNSAMDALSTERDVIWIPTYGKGIYKFSATDTLSITTIDGLSSNFTRQVLSYDHYIIVSNSEGLDIISEGEDKELVIKKVPFDEEVKDIRVFGDSLFVLTRAGFYTIPPEFFSEKPPVPFFVLNEITLDGNRVSSKEKVSISPSQRSLLINFTTIFFGPNRHNEFRYQLVSSRSDMDAKSWLRINGNEIQLSNLRPDKYELYVQYKTELTHWSNGAIIQIVVQPEWYKSWWFFLLLVLLVSGLVVSIVLTIKGVIDAQKRMKADKLFAELTAKKSQIKPHFLFNALNSIRNYILNNELEKSDAFLMTYSHLMRQVLNISDTNLITINKELELIETYLKLEQMRLSNSFEYEIDIQKSELLDYLFPAMVLQPFVENAILHGVTPLEKKGKINIAVRAIKNLVLIEIHDNGVGFDTDLENSQDSKGSQIMKNKLELFQQFYRMKIDLKMLSSPDKGTTVTLTIPAIK